ncbi:MAG: helix-turn-helix transcriptional regulator [Desulfatiglans sp.]|jgi:excisionase family DNA binding protein|nr:helix-turn-helix transcriptional regulator [Desulfatiglans sp.]
MVSKIMLNTRQVAEFLDINEKMVYSLITEKGLPATKVTGKWLFPKHLVEQWLEASTINYPKAINPLPPYDGILIICGSNDLLLEKTISLYNRQFPGHAAVFGNMGSLGGLRSLKGSLCHIASSHLLEENEKEYNFDFAHNELGQLPAIVNFCRREQGIIVKKGNPKGITGIMDIKEKGLRIVNRPKGTGTRLLLEGELKKADIDTASIPGYDLEVERHIDVSIEILSGRADAGLAIKAAASLLDLDFIPLRMERFDLIMHKERFFDKGIQMFLGLLRCDAFKGMAEELDGYDLSITGEMVYPQQG